MQTSAELHLPIESLEDAIERCQLLGMRLSRQRRYILELLWKDKEHLSARDIYDRLNRQGREIGHTSVYQNLEALSEQGVIECVERSDGRLYGHISSSHSHVNCLDTQKIIDIDIELPAYILQQVEAQTGISISDYRIDFFGQAAISEGTQSEGTQSEGAQSEGTQNEGAQSESAKAPNAEG
ncbi:MAG: Fur family transcriptional regulator [Phormidesmis sp.]